MRDDEGPLYRCWSHSPSHLFEPGAAYFITASTYRKAKLFHTDQARDFLLKTIFEEAEHWEWRLQAWAVMSNHYHLVSHAPADAKTLRRFTGAVHSKTAIWLNKHENTPGRKVWFQYRDTCLTYQRSYLARLNYTHQNPANHRLIANAENYRWCSMAWFVQNARPGFVRTVLSFKTDRLNIDDDF